MKIPFGTINISQESKKLMQEVLSSGRVSNGKYVSKFEKLFAKRLGLKYGVAVSSGADAVSLALATLYDFGAKRQDEIILPALSFVATGNAVLQAGFKPVFVDIDPCTLNIDPGKIEQAITKKTQGILAVHLMGKPADMDKIGAIAKKHRLFVIEDAAEAHGALYKGKPVGTLGDLAAFSLYIAHIISTVEGGIVVTKNKSFAEVLRSLRCHGRACKCEICVLNTRSSYCPRRFKFGRDIRFVFERIGFSSKMNELEAAVGLGNIKQFNSILKKRRKNLISLIRAFREFSPYLYTIQEAQHERIGPHAFPIIISKNAPFSRDELTIDLEKNGIDTRDLFSSMPTQCPGFSFLGYKKGDFPNAEFIGLNGLHIGVHQDLKKGEINYIIRTIRNFLKNHT